MKKVLYDNQAFDTQIMGGVSRQFVELFKNLKNYQPIIGAENTKNIYLKEHWNNIDYAQNPNTNNTLYSMYLESTQAYDIFHPTYFDPSFLNLIKKPFVGTIHDMILEKDCKNMDDVIKIFNETTSQDTKRQISGKNVMVQRADAIIAVSENTKKDIIRIMNCDSNKIHVCYPGISKDLYDIEENEKCKAQLNFDYILYVGTRIGIKNFDRFIREFAKIHKKYPDLKLICTGYSFTDNEKMLFNELEISDSVMHCKFNNDSQMATLYKNAKCFIFPSLYEGFGLPIVEAFACNCPVLLNNTSCFPEIGGDAAIYFNLTEEKNDFMEVFEKFMNMSEDEVNDYKKRGYERSKRFTFQKFTESVEKVYDEVLEKYKGKK